MISSSNTVAALIRRTQTGIDEYNDPVYGETATGYPAIFWPGGTFESTKGQDQVTWTATVCLPAGANVAAVDAVIPQAVVDSSGRLVLDGDGKAQGDRYEIDGQPDNWPPNPFTGTIADFPVVIPLKRTVD